ncbi:response regulator transcription factor [Scandinavium sp. NPDC088450]|uniref:response regulator transcription factor n=1 Tax=Scandinavium sp. NPDC088450 TaxID=3364514 RepID=UPI00384DB219
MDDKNLNVLIVNDNCYYQSGIHCILNDFFTIQTTIHYEKMKERDFAESVNGPDDFKIPLETPLVFAGDYPYRRLKRLLRHTPIALFGPQHTPDDVRKKLAHLNFAVSHPITVPSTESLLSAREGVLYEHMKNGLTDDRISHLMNITKKTVSSHRGHILKKLGYRNKLTLFAREYDFI